MQDFECGSVRSIEKEHNGSRQFNIATNRIFQQNCEQIKERKIKSGRVNTIGTSNQNKTNYTNMSR